MSSQSAADILREAKKGSAELVILALLEHTPRHGYELAARIEKDSEGALSYNFASLYATLYKLEERGWVQGRWVERPGQRRRRYYRLTAAGSRGARRSATSGSSSCRRWAASPASASPEEAAMNDWQQRVRRHIHQRGLPLPGRSRGTGHAPRRRMGGAARRRDGRPRRLCRRGAAARRHPPALRRVTCRPRRCRSRPRVGAERPGWRAASHDAAMARAPVFTTAVVAVLALGIGATTRPSPWCTRRCWRRCPTPMPIGS